jgi:hypothetical protein
VTAGGLPAGTVGMPQQSLVFIMVVNELFIFYLFIMKKN